MKRKILAALLAACTVLSFTGCAGSKDPVSETSKESSAAAESSAVESQAEEVKELLPYTGDEVTFTYFWFDMGDNFETKKDLPMVQAVQEKMGNIKLAKSRTSWSSPTCPTPCPPTGKTTSS